MNKLPAEKRAAIIRCLVDGVSIRATCRIVGVAKGTILKLLPEVGEAVREYQRSVFVNLPCTKLQLDEIWGFVASKEKNTDPELRGMGKVGDVWTWTAICADTKLMPCWHVGARDAFAAKLFLDDLAPRLANRVQLTTDGHHAYLSAVGRAFGYDVDYAQIVKVYGGQGYPKGRYSPAELLRIEKNDIIGKPDEKHISTSFAERANLTMRMNMRRFTRLTNAFSKKVENHLHSVSLHMMHYNFCRAHQTLTLNAKGIHTTPAMAAGITDHVWKIEEIIALLPN